MVFKKRLNKMCYIILLLLLVTNCTQDRCLNCDIYEMLDFEGNLEDFYESILVCEGDHMWDEIVWGEYSDNSGGDFAFIDLDIYTLGYRVIENTDVDNDGIINQYDDDIDNDGTLNFEDTSPYGIKDNSLIELIICTEKE